MQQTQFYSSFFPMEYSTSVKAAGTKVIVAKTVIIIKHLAARAKSGSLWNCKIYFATEGDKIQSHLRYLLQLHQSNVR